MNKQTNRETDKQTNRKTNKQTNKQINKQTNKQTLTERQTDIQTKNRQTDKQILLTNNYSFVNASHLCFRYRIKSNVNEFKFKFLAKAMCSQSFLNNYVLFNYFLFCSPFKIKPFIILFSQ
jgi:hypothetical protein